MSLLTKQVGGCESPGEGGGKGTGSRAKGVSFFVGSAESAESMAAV